MSPSQLDTYIARFDVNWQIISGRAEAIMWRDLDGSELDDIEEYEDAGFILSGKKTVVIRKSAVLDA